jgi:hypothetical protein
MQGVLFLIVLGPTVASAESRMSVVTELDAEYRYGQTFLTWQESAVPVGKTFNVHLSRSPIIDEATLAEPNRSAGGSNPDRWRTGHATKATVPPVSTSSSATRRMLATPKGNRLILMK